jgi:hypothetical protein
MLVSSWLARRDVATAASEANLSVDAVMVAPVPADFLGGEVVIRTTNGYLRGSHHWLGAPRTRLERITVPLEGGTSDLSPAQFDELVRKASEHPDVRHYLAWSRFPYYRITATSSGYRVRISDMRYDTRGAGSLGGVQVPVTAPLPEPESGP